MKNKIEMHCKRCGHRWTYTGNKSLDSIYPQFVTCPKCLTSVKLSEYLIK
jgi:hypothetical protein